MKRWNLIEQAAADAGGRTLSLLEHDGEYRIRIGSEDLMSTRGHASEEKLAELACADLKTRRGARVLIGGLGMGFTLKAALAVLPSDAEVITAEIFAAVIAWNRNPALPLGSAAMADKRVTVVHRDVVEVIRENRAGFDSIILDVDNGPAALSAEGNGRLYDAAGLLVVKSALRRGGCAAFWSAAPDAQFEKVLRRAGLHVEVHRANSNGDSGRKHVLFLAKNVTI